MPILENIGFRVISERTFEVGDEGAGSVFVHDMELENAFAGPIDLADGGALFEEVFLSVWHGEADNDGYNSLAQTAELGASAIGILRAYGRYLQQAGIPAEPGFHRRGAQPLSRHCARPARDVRGPSRPDSRERKARPRPSI